MPSFFGEKESFVNIGLQKSNIYFYDVTDSTNTRAREHFLLCRPDEPVLFAALSQTSGRGTRGRSFESKGGTGLYFSLLFSDCGKDFDTAALTPLAAVSLIEALREQLPCEKRGEPYIKWVNDIYVGKKKISGILCEKALSTDGKAGYIVGVGVNLFGSDFSESIRNIAGSAEQTLGVRLDPSLLLTSTLSRLLSGIKNPDRETLLSLYRENMISSGTGITVTDGLGSARSATALGIDSDFRLLVEYEGGEREALVSGDVSIRI